MSNYQHERGWLDSEVWGDAPYSEREAWSWMIGEASWKDQLAKNILGSPTEIKRGQFSHSIRFMGKKFQWSIGKVQRFLKKLTIWNMIEISQKTDTQTDTGQNIITICNYNIYQNKNGKTDTQTDTQADTPPIHMRVQTRNPSNPSNPSNQLINTPHTPHNPPPPKQDLKAAIDLYNETANRIGIPIMQKLSDTRKRRLEARLCDCGGLDGWVAALAKVEASGFLKGENDHGWKADFDFIVRESSFIKIMEGKYNGKPRTSSDRTRDALTEWANEPVDH